MWEMLTPIGENKENKQGNTELRDTDRAQAGKCKYTRRETDTERSRETNNRETIDKGKASGQMTEN